MQYTSMPTTLHRCWTGTLKTKGLFHLIDLMYSHVQTLNLVFHVCEPVSL